jgi:hypothetical protein
VLVLILVVVAVVGAGSAAALVSFCSPGGADPTGCFFEAGSGTTAEVVAARRSSAPGGVVRPAVAEELGRGSFLRAGRGVAGWGVCGEAGRLQRRPASATATAAGARCGGDVGRSAAEGATAAAVAAHAAVVVLVLILGVGAVVVAGSAAAVVSFCSPGGADPTGCFFEAGSGTSAEVVAARRSSAPGGVVRAAAAEEIGRVSFLRAGRGVAGLGVCGEEVDGARGSTAAAWSARAASRIAAMTLAKAPTRGAAAAVDPATEAAAAVAAGARAAGTAPSILKSGAGSEAAARGAGPAVAAVPGLISTSPPDPSGEDMCGDCGLRLWAACWKKPRCCRIRRRKNRLTVFPPTATKERGGTAVTRPLIPGRVRVITPSRLPAPPGQSRVGGGRSGA